MEGKSYVYLKWVLCCIFLVQFPLGVCGLISGETAMKAIAVFYGGGVEMTPQMDYVVRMMGAYILAISLMALFALLDPARSIAIVYGLIILMVIRGLEALCLANQVAQSFDMSIWKARLDGVLFLIVAVLLFSFRPKAQVLTKKEEEIISYKNTGWLIFIVVYLLYAILLCLSSC